MGLINKSKDMHPFDMKQKPKKQSPFLLPFIWSASFLATRKFHLKINKYNMKGLKPPYLVLATHKGFSDYYIAPLALFPHRAIYVSDIEGFAAFGKKLYRSIGCIGKRRYVSDINVMLNIKSAISQGQSVVLYPEARHSNIGITSYIPDNMGRLAKLLNIPLVILSANGSYLANPFWNEKKTRKIPITVTLECIYDTDQLKNTDADKIQKTIVEKLNYDEYEYQHKNGFLISDADRAEGLDKALYQCINCFNKYNMTSTKSTLKCNCCGEKWELTKDGWLKSKEDKKIHLPNWYKWQKKQAEAEINNNFHREYSVEVYALPNEKGFVNLGVGHLTLNKEAFILSYLDISGKEKILNFIHSNRESVQTEYNYREKGACIVLSTKDCCFYLYSNDSNFEPTELQFIGEFLHQKNFRKHNHNIISNANRTFL